MKKKSNDLRDKIKKINSIKNNLEKLNEGRKVFTEVLKDDELYIIGLPETTKEDIEGGRVKAYIQRDPSGTSKYYFKIFNDETTAKDFARKIGAVLEDGTEIVIKENSKEVLAQLRDAFMLIGIDGVLLDDGVNWITISTEELLRIAYVDVLNIPQNYNVDFVNTVRAVHDINKKNFRLVAPIKHYEGITKSDFLEGKSSLFPLNNEIIIIEYYDKYKVEDIFKDKVYWLDMDIKMFYKIIEKASEEKYEKINIVYNGMQASSMPRDILNLLKLFKID